MTTAEEWSTADLAAHLQRADPEAAGQVIRVLAARLAVDACEVTDPRSLLRDISCAVASLTSAVNRVARTACADVLAADDGARDDLGTTLAHLKMGGRSVGAIADGWI